jgi:CubicO group peptidase (beta-lactamase class C family)
MSVQARVVTVTAMDLVALLGEAVAAAPGAAVAVRRAGEPPLVVCHGLADIEWQCPVGTDTVFRLASLSKPFTALAAVLLARDGVLDLDAPIDRYLPDFDEQSLVPHRAAGYGPGPGDTFLNAPYLNMSVPGGAGGLGASLDDLTAFDRALEAGVFGDLSDAFAPLTRRGGRSEGYGLGWAINTYRGHRVLHHTGGIQGFSNMYDAVLELPPPDHPEAAVSPARVAARAGVYTEPLGEVEIGTLADGTGLTALGMEFRPASDEVYVCRTDPDVTMRFHGRDGAVTVTYPLFWPTLYGPAA